MAGAALFQPSFGGGILSPGLRVRSDLARYDIGLSEGLNALVMPGGGVMNRSGTQFVCEVLDQDEPHRLVPFSRDEDERMALVLGPGTMQVIYQGGLVQDGGSDLVIPTPFDAAAVASLDYAQSVDVMFFACSSVFPQEMRRESNTVWTFTDLKINPDGITPPTITAAGAGSLNRTEYRYVMSSVVDGEEGYPGNEWWLLGDLSAGPCDVHWAAVPGVDKYRIYRGEGYTGVFGYVATAAPDATRFFDLNVARDLTITPVSPAEIFETAADYPTCVAIWQQRLVFAGSDNDPETVWTSRLGNYRNFTASETPQADDRAEVVLAGQSVNRIKALVPKGDLLGFGSEAEFSLSGPDGAFSATNPVIKQHSSEGSGFVRPIEVTGSVLFVDATGWAVRDFAYSLERDGYAGVDLTVFSDHLFEGRTIASWAFAKNRGSVIWVALDDGSLLSLTYKAEQEVAAWTRHDIGGAVESVCVLPGQPEDEVYFSVRRVVAGQVKRYVERLAPRYGIDNLTDGVFLDCSLSYSGAPVSTVSGLDHLEGATVTAVADGGVYPDLVVTGGGVTVPVAASKIHVGLPYVTVIEDLPPSLTLQSSGAARVRIQTISRVMLDLHRSLGVTAGPDAARQVEIRNRSEMLDENDPLMTGLFEVAIPSQWSRRATVRVEQRQPWPMTIYGITKELTIGG